MARIVTAALGHAERRQRVGQPIITILIKGSLQALEPGWQQFHQQRSSGFAGGVPKPHGLPQRIVSGQRRVGRRLYSLGPAKHTFIDVRKIPAQVVRVDGSDHSIDRKSTRLNSSHQIISYAVFCLKKKTLSLTASVASSGVLAITCFTMSAGFGAGLIA